MLQRAKAKEDLGRALKSFKTGYGRGIPFFTVGIQHLRNGLYAFSEKDGEAKKMLESVENVVPSVDATQTFTVMTIRSD